MAKYLGINKSNKSITVELSQEEKDWYESEGSPVKGKYTFQLIEDKTPKAPAPVEAKQVNQKEEK